MSTKEHSVNPKGLTLLFLSKSYNEVIYGESFILEKKIDGIWYEYPIVIDGEYGFKDIGYELPPGEEREFKVDWQWLYGELEPGEYRIIKDISNLEDSGDYKTYYLAAEFEIE
ncbi:immunoglobulin-like domain-containing protein [Tissierella creatinophila]|uniref:Bacterial Ig-like domain-containing protein n=1 Tax=Tissierella creatinophila DSM 6911 TaxID=1123403 RepID=A0A1U7M7P2_TISCR|nr:immunoglobulin-like domain-containing protein [Tissierella creatinophila]OLS03218.1 hypothetical protein TICRE_09190 [Tissierella creatinophila DSM 6911]